MCIGDTRTGGKCPFNGEKLLIAAGDFHVSAADPTHTYRLDVMNENGVVYSENIRCEKTSHVALETENCAYYRAEIWDETIGFRIAIGNPIWNTERM